MQSAVVAVRSVSKHACIHVGSAQWNAASKSCNILLGRTGMIIV